MPSVLVVDDSAVDRRLVVGLLAKADQLTVRTAEDGKKALEYMKQVPPDLVVTDLMMPIMDGLELVAHVVTQFPQVPIILMTGKGNEETAVRALRAGAASYVPKNLLGDLLLETVEHVLQVGRQELSQQQMMRCLVHSHNTFVLGNDVALIPPLVGFLNRTMRAVGMCDDGTAVRVCVALEEALNNAVIHGNLEISSEYRDGNLAQYRRLLDERRHISPYEGRTLRVEAHVTASVARISIGDDGPGFNPETLPDPRDPANLEKASGRGLLLMRTFMDEVNFNAIGNEVTLVKWGGTRH